MIYVLIGLFLGCCFISLVSIVSLHEKNGSSGQQGISEEGEASMHKKTK